MNSSRWPRSKPRRGPASASPPPACSSSIGGCPSACVTSLYGVGGFGKSRLALQMAAGIASGGSDARRWIGGATAPLIGNAIDSAGAPVLFCSWEDDAHEQARRLSQIHGAADAPWVTPDRTDKLHLVNLIGAGPAWGADVGRHISTVGKLQVVGQRIQQTAESIGAKLVVLDSLAAAYMGNENDRAAVRSFLNAWYAWAAENAAAVLLIAHESKSDIVSGSTDWEAGARSLLTFTAAKTCGDPHKTCKPSCTPPAVKLEHAKANYGPKWSALRLDMGTRKAGGGGLRWRVHGLWDRPGDAQGDGDDGNGAAPGGKAL